MAPRQIYASSLNRRESSWSRPRRRGFAWYPLWAIGVSAVLTQVLQVLG